MTKQKRRHTFLALTLLVLFAGYLTGIMGFTHVHCVNGVTIVHSHPFQGTHDHTASETLTLHFLSTFDTPEPAAVEMLHPVWQLLAQLDEGLEVEQAEVVSVRPPSLRAPPQESDTTLFVV